MIISASRRTDIPLYFSQWFEDRLREGFVDVANPFNAKQIKRVDLSEQAVDGFVFWTKYPQPMLDNTSLMARLDHFPYYFNFTLTPYGGDLEPGIPDKMTRVLPTFKRLSDKIGPDRVVWRYDPILMGANNRLTTDYHIGAFEEWAESLKGYTHDVVISFFDDYARCRKRMVQKGLDLTISDSDQFKLAQAFGKIAGEKGMRISACSEPLDFRPFGIEASACVDAKRFSAMTGKDLGQKRDPNQRPNCGCSKSIDIGSYFTCKAACVYCYAFTGTRSSNAF